MSKNSSPRKGINYKSGINLTCGCILRAAKTLPIILALAVNLACTKLQSSNQWLPGSNNHFQLQIHNPLATLSLGDLALVVDASFGGRIIEFSLNGKNALLSEGKLTGSTFWTSPQKDWGWPPPPAIDTNPFEIQQHGRKLRLVGTTESNLGVRVEKMFSANAQGNGFDITYTIRNMSDRTVKLAPWEVTRVSGGYTFYPTTGKQVRNDLNTTEIDGITWYFYRPDELSGEVNHKVLEDGSEGWIANVNLETGLLFVKTYPDINSAQFAPDEAEIEIYASLRNNYIEIEQQGAYAEISPTSTVDWTVTWYLQNIDTKKFIGIGDPEIVQRSRTAPRFSE